MTGKSNLVDFTYPQDFQARHNTKEEKENRRETQVCIGKPEYIMPKTLRGNKIAIAKWTEITTAYIEANLSITSSTDIATLTRYCLLFSEYEEIVRHPYENPVRVYNINKKNNKLEAVKAFPGELDDYTKYQRVKSQIRNDLLKLENCLFLNPLSKYKNIPMAIKKPQKSELEQKGFDI